jgi:hypothetical protein
MNLASPIAGTFPTVCIEALFGLIHHIFRSQAVIQKTHPQATSLLPGFTELIFIVVLFSALGSGGQNAQH